MKSIQTRMAAALLIVAGSMLPVYGQGRGRDQGWDRSDRPQERERQRGQGREQQARPQEARPRMQMQQALPQQDRRGGSAQYQQRDRRDGGQNQYQYRQQMQDSPRRSYEQQRGYPEVTPQNNYRGGASFEQFSSRNWQNDRRNWSQRGGYRGYFIPQTRFHSSFGRQNYFRIGRPEFYGGYPRFQYGGYTFRIVDPWPDYWGSDWYESDDVYIDYENDGYYMYNSRYPDTGISVDIDY